MKIENLNPHLKLGVMNEVRSELPQPDETHVRVPHESRPVLVDVRGAGSDDGEAAGRSHSQTTHAYVR